MATQEENEPSPMEMLGAMLTAANAEQLRTQAMLQTLIGILLDDKQKQQYNTEIGKTLKKLLKNHIEAYPQLYHSDDPGRNKKETT
jgi:hypothetical protein